MKRLYNKTCSNSMQIGNKKPVTVSSSESGVASDIPEDRFQELIAKYQPPKNTRWYEDNRSQAQRDSVIADIMERNRIRR